MPNEHTPMRPSLVESPIMIDDENDKADLRDVQEILAEVHHDLKNPLSIIDGNAQYLLELEEMLDLDKEVVTSVADIQEAAERLRDSLDRLSELREELETSELERRL